MPVPLSDLVEETHLKVLLMGAPKIWKTTTAVVTSPHPVRVILCEADSALAESKRQGAADYTDVERITGENAWEQMTTALATAKEDAKAGKIATVVIDPLSDFTDRLCAQSHRMNRSADGKEDGRRAFPHYTSRLLHCIQLALSIPAHLIVISHYIDTGPGMDTGVKKRGEGIVPLIQGSVRSRVAAAFNDVLWQDIDPADPRKRVFYLSPQGAYGPGCRSLSSKYEVLPANFGGLIEAIEGERRGEGPKPAPGLASNGHSAPAKPLQPPVNRNQTKPSARPVQQPKPRK